MWRLNNFDSRAMSEYVPRCSKFGRRRTCKCAANDINAYEGSVSYTVLSDGKRNGTSVVVVVTK